MTRREVWISAAIGIIIATIFTGSWDMAFDAVIWMGAGLAIHWHANKPKKQASAKISVPESETVSPPQDCKWCFRNLRCKETKSPIPCDKYRSSIK
jgi:hypothetical protein